MNKRLLIGFVFLNTLFLCAQNVVDKNGLKQGVWSKNMIGERPVMKVHFRMTKR
ncbi:MAG: hypothetical protein CM15mP23_08690 [Cryomorphaceae bacterium]|nr:MAG: hypothetical protein CM15mP23_08690 [Cryomorphaceae bacterium]